MADLNLNGVGVALVTPFKESGDIDFDTLEKIIENIIAGGADYIVALGTTAETPTLTKEEKFEIAGFIREVNASRLPLIIGIGGNNTKAVMIKTGTFDLSGYSAILSVTPYYNKPSQEGIFQHFKAVAEISPLPILLYNIPSRTGVNMTALTTLRLANLSGKFCGVKEASGNLEQCKEIIDKAPEGFSVVSGDDAATFPLMKIGGKGVISVLANALPGEVKRLFNTCKDENEANALSCHNSLMPICTSLFEEGNPAGIKALLSILGFGSNILRLPLVPVSEAIKRKLEKEAALLLK